MRSLSRVGADECANQKLNDFSLARMQKSIGVDLSSLAVGYAPNIAERWEKLAFLVDSAEEFFGECRSSSWTHRYRPASIANPSSLAILPGCGCDTTDVFIKEAIAEVGLLRNRP